MRRANLEPPPSPADSSPPPTPIEPPKELPEWFELRPFQYNGRMLVAALPGLCLALALSGELLLGIVAIGGLLIHFVQSGGAKRRAVLVFLCVFIAAQMAIIYSALPLLWESLYHFITILLLNMSVVMTGGWALVHFEEFLKEEPSLAEIIEMSLFTIYPTVSVAITCCMLAMLTSSHYMPYSIIIHGFFLLRLFVTPSQPSFRKQNFGSHSVSKAFVLGHAEVSLLLILYVSAPAELFIIFNVWNLFELITVTELLFVVAAPCFLMTLLELRTWTDCFGIPYKYIIWMRWTTGLASLFLGSVILKYTQDSVLVHWLLLTVLANVLLGWTASRKGQIQHMFKFVCGIALILVYVLAVQFSIPWHFDIPTVDMTILSLALITNATLSVACFMVCNTQNQRLTSTLLITLMGGVVFTESFLYKHQLYSPLLMLSTSLSSAYLLVRLLSAGTVVWYCTWIGSALHAFKLPFFIEILSSTGKVETEGSLSIVALTLTITKLMFFEHRTEMPSKEIFGYILSISTSLLLSYQSLLQPMWRMSCGNSPTILQTVCVIIAFSAIVCLKLTMQHLHHLPKARKFNILVLISTGLALVVQPSLALRVQNLSSWLTLIGGTLGVAVILGIVPHDQRPSSVFAKSVVLGLASGLRASGLLLTTADKLTTLQYTLSCMACSFILLTLWTNFKSVRPVRGQFLLKPAVTFLAIVGSLTYISEVSQVTKTNLSLVEGFLTPCLRLYCAISLLLGFALRSYCLFLQSRDPFGFVPDQVATTSNLMTVSAYLLACVNCPIEPWEIWNSGCALLLLNLQQDPDIITSLTAKRRTGIVLAACLLNVYSATVMHSDLFRWGVGLYALLEAAVLVATLPVFATLVQHQVVSNFSPNIELLVFLTPLNAVFFLVGSSYTSWLLGAIGLCGGFWMLYKKLTSKETQ